MEEKKKLDNITKAKLVYSLELGAFSLLFLVIAILKYFDVITFSDRYRERIFPIVTLLGGTWFIIDLVWAIVSSKHREKSAIIDKILVAPGSLSTIIFDVYLLINGPLNVDYVIFKTYSATLFIYISIIYAFQAIYHFKHPLPYLVNEIKKAEEEEEKERQLEEEKKALEEINSEEKTSSNEEVSQ